MPSLVGSEMCIRDSPKYSALGINKRIHDTIANELLFGHEQLVEAEDELAAYWMTLRNSSLVNGGESNGVHSPTNEKNVETATTPTSAGVPKKGSPSNGSSATAHPSIALVPSEKALLVWKGLLGFKRTYVELGKKYQRPLNALADVQQIVDSSTTSKFAEIAGSSEKSVTEAAKGEGLLKEERTSITFARTRDAYSGETMGIYVDFKKRRLEILENKGIKTKDDGQLIDKQCFEGEVLSDSEENIKVN
eukprot:TRINITY_DN1885_c0_g1_i2.p1 TRINITY_DN1885_c0_g1~~TRINITY_DN1885_c0_g1_i2.p1  ORF type:complete len:249 (-),score=67.86 TRINITY_DN1885_c0_g1_i2:345-1091(-)